MTSSVYRNYHRGAQYIIKFLVFVLGFCFVLFLRGVAFVLFFISHYLPEIQRESGKGNDPTSL